MHNTIVVHLFIIIYTIHSYKELETIKLCLKHFRQQNMMDIYYALQKKTQVEFEHPIISSLHQTLVVDGDFDKAEQMIRNADSSGVFQPYVQTSRYSPEWQRICALNDGSSDILCLCHQLIF